jgi:hypothetical protein
MCQHKSRFTILYYAAGPHIVMLRYADFLKISWKRVAECWITLHRLYHDMDMKFTDEPCLAHLKSSRPAAGISEPYRWSILLCKLWSVPSIKLKFYDTWYQPFKRSSIGTAGTVYRYISIPSHLNFRETLSLNVLVVDQGEFIPWDEYKIREENGTESGFAWIIKDPDLRKSVGKYPPSIFMYRTYFSVSGCYRKELRYHTTIPT